LVDARLRFAAASSSARSAQHRDQRRRHRQQERDRALPLDARDEWFAGGLQHQSAEQAVLLLHRLRHRHQPVGRNHLRRGGDRLWQAGGRLVRVACEQGA
jgi:hypothetical protein